MLILLPNLLSPESTTDDTFTPSVALAVASLDGLIAESPKGGRAFLRHFGRLDLPQFLLNEHTKDLSELLEPLKAGKCLGLVSDCGLPCLADPGRELVLSVQALNIPVKAYSGPSSIPLALMLSGLPAQSFTFHGYLERDPSLLVPQLLALQQQRLTHLFIEAPYRNEKLFAILVKTLKDKTLLSIASDLTGPAEAVHTHTVAGWRKLPPPAIGKSPTLFLFYP
jgi:16S rRNA (cytidine1402-2'-O)-methyltransferase